MTKKELLEALADVPDDALILIADRDFAMGWVEHRYLTETIREPVHHMDTEYTFLPDEHVEGKITAVVLEACD